MNRLINIALVIFSFSYTNFISAQMNVELVNSGQILVDANLYNSLGKYAKAESMYLKVSRNDTNYAAVLRDLAYTYIDDKEDSLALQTARRGKELDSEYKSDFYKLIGISLKEMGKYDTAIKTFNEGIRLYPYKYLLVYEKGMCYVKMKKYTEAQECFEKTLELNPYHASSHFQLGKTCAEQGRLIPAILSYEYFLMIENSSERAAKVVSALEDLYSGESQPDPDMELTSTEAGDNCFSDLNTLITSKIAFEPDYKNKTIIKLKMVKALQAMLEKMHYEAGTKNWWMENYVPFYVELQQKGFLAPFASHTLYGVSDNPSVAKSVKKNKKKMKVFASWASDFIKAHSKHPARDLFTDKENLDVTFYENNNIAGVGQVNKLKVENGDWYYFYMRTGHLLSKGKYENGKRVGEWNWYYDDGTQRERTNFSNGLRNGLSEQFFSNGLPSFKCSYSNDLLDGDYTAYGMTGQLTEKATFKLGKFDGPATAYYGEGRKKADLNYKMGKLDGDLIFYTIDGKMYKKVAQLNDVRNGHSVEYYSSGKIKSEGDYKNDNAIGTWKSYWDNGKVFREGECKEGGLRNGEWKEYYHDGTLSVNARYVSGKLTGKTEYYDTDGKLFSEKTYAADKLKLESFLDKNGKVIAEYTIKDDDEITEYFANGERSGKGSYYAGERDGDWKIYSENGAWLYAKVHYKNGELNGTRTEYFESGEESSELEYRNGERDGYLKSFYQNGTIEQEGWYVYGEKQGDWYEYNQRGVVSAHRYYMNDEIYGYQVFNDEKGKKDEEDYYNQTNLWSRTRFDSLGNVIYKTDLKNGNGVYDFKYNTGKTCVKQEYKYGLLDGATDRYEYNGTKTVETFFIVGQQHGKRQEFFDSNGKVSLDADYAYDERNGAVVAFHENGNKRYEENYYNGDLDGKQKYYRENGTLMKEGVWDLGTLNGELKLYADDGSLQFIRYYKDGNILGYSYLDKDGKVMPMIALENASGKFVAYYQNGNKSIEGEYVNGRFNGIVIEYFSDGKVAEEENYKYGDFTGMQKYYYHNGNVKKQQNYFGDELDGTCTYNFEDGKVEHTEYYVLGDNFGTWVYYDESGAVVKKCGWYDDMQFSEVTAPAVLNSNNSEKAKTPKPKSK